MSPFWILLELRVIDVVVTTAAIKHAKLQSKSNQHPVFLQAGCPSSRPTNSVKAHEHPTVIALKVPLISSNLPILTGPKK